MLCERRVLTQVSLGILLLMLSIALQNGAGCNRSIKPPELLLAAL